MSLTDIFANGFLRLKIIESTNGGQDTDLNLNLLAFLIYVACALIGYLFSSINFAVIISRIYGEDIRSKGSGNAGATNMMRIYGKKASVLTFVGDFLKAVVACLICRLLLVGFIGACIAGLFCIIGHAFPVYFGFRGGKGVAVGAAMALCCDIFVFIIVIATFLIVVLLSRMISLGSVLAASMYPLGIFIFRGPGAGFLLALISGALIIILHRQNISRIIKGTERQIKFGSKKKKEKVHEKKIEETGISYHSEGENDKQE